VEGQNMLNGSAPVSTPIEFSIGCKGNPMLLVRTYAQKHPYLTIWAALVVLLILWETLARQGVIDSREWTAPSEIAKTLVKDSFFVTPSQGDQHRSKSLITHAVFTIFRWLQGFSLAVCAGVTVGYVLGRCETCSALGYPVVNVLR